MTNFVNTTFTGANGDFITSIVGSLGEVYTGVQNGLYIVENRLVPRFANTSLYQAGNAPDTSEYDAIMTINPKGLDGGGVFVGVLGRYLDANGNGYVALVSSDDGAGNGRIRLFTVVGYSYDTQLGSTHNFSFTVDTPFVVTLEIRNATKKVYLDGVEIISSADNSITQTGRIGVNGFNGNGNDDNVLAITSLVGTNFGTAATPPTADFTSAVDRKTVTITDTSSAGTNPITGRSVDWGDGTTNSSLSHTYAVGGAYTISMTVTDGSLTSDPVTEDIVTTTGYRYRVKTIAGSSTVATSQTVTAERPDA